MKNLEQVRAAAALPVAGQTTKADANALPAMLIANGLLATAAFANEKTKKGVPKRREMQAVINGVARHLASADIGITPGATDTDSLIKKLTDPQDVQANSVRLQRATAETLLFIGYVKRFATKEKSGSKD